MCIYFFYFFFFFKQKTAYEMRISDWSSDVCSSDLLIWIIIIQDVLSWLVAFNVINVHNQFVRTVLNAIDRITEPLLRLIRRLMRDLGGIDFSPMELILVLIVIQRLLLDLVIDAATL